MSVTSAGHAQVRDRFFYCRFWQIHTSPAKWREATRTLYRSILPALIHAAAEEVSAEKGVKLVRQSPPAPILMELHSPMP